MRGPPRGGSRVGTSESADGSEAKGLRLGHEANGVATSTLDKQGFLMEVVRRLG
jgi:hypothetical protein